MHARQLFGYSLSAEMRDAEGIRQIRQGRRIALAPRTKPIAWRSGAGQNGQNFDRLPLESADHSENRRSVCGVRSYNTLNRKDTCPLRKPPYDLQRRPGEPRVIQGTPVARMLSTGLSTNH
jgi:hypothetical protein